MSPLVSSINEVTKVLKAGNPGDLPNSAGINEDPEEKISTGHSDDQSIISDYQSAIDEDDGQSSTKEKDDDSISEQEVYYDAFEEKQMNKIPPQGAVNQEDLLKKFTQEFAPLKEAIEAKDPIFLEFFSGILSDVFKREDIVSVEVKKDSELGSMIKLVLKEPIEVTGGMDKQMGFFKRRAFFTLKIPQTLQMSFGNDRSLNFYTPLDLTVAVLGISAQALVSKLDVNLSEDKPFFDYESSVQNSVFNNSELLTLAVVRNK